MTNVHCWHWVTRTSSRTSSNDIHVHPIDIEQTQYGIEGQEWFISLLKGLGHLHWLVMKWFTWLGFPPLLFILSNQTCMIFVLIKCNVIIQLQLKLNWKLHVVVILFILSSFDDWRGLFKWLILNGYFSSLNFYVEWSFNICLLDDCWCFVKKL